MEELLQSVTPLQLALISLSSIAIVEAFKAPIKKKLPECWQTTALVLLSALAGALISIPIGVEWYIGLIIGAFASGLITVSKSLRSQSNEQEPIQIDVASDE